jgi:hypothetical protein
VKAHIFVNRTFLMIVLYDMYESTCYQYFLERQSNVAK